VTCIGELDISVFFQLEDSTSDKANLPNIPKNLGIVVQNVSFLYSQINIHIYFVDHILNIKF